MSEYLTLFFTALISATILPMGSEVLLVYDYLHGFAFWALLFFATFGNVLGSIINYWLGFKGEEYLLSKNILKKERIEKSKQYFDKYGGFALLLSWVPIIGDPIVLIAGALQYRFISFVSIVIIAKFGRYFILLQFVYN